MRRLRAVVLAAALCACDGDGGGLWLLAPVPLAAIDGTWERELPSAGPRVDPAPRQWLSIGGGRYLLASGNLGDPLGAFVRGDPGIYEAGRVREVDGALQWTVDSIVVVGATADPTVIRRRVERNVLHVEGHPLAGAVARLAGDVLVLAGRNSATGAPGTFTARFRRVRGVPPVAGRPAVALP